MVCDGQQNALHFVLKPGGKAERDIWIENRSDKQITISKIETSCECTTIKKLIPEMTFAPSERNAVRVVVDLSNDPKFSSDFWPTLTINQYLTLAIRISVKE